MFFLLQYDMSVDLELEDVHIRGFFDSKQSCIDKAKQLNFKYISRYAGLNNIDNDNVCLFPINNEYYESNGGPLIKIHNTIISKYAGGVIKSNMNEINLFEITNREKITILDFITFYNEFTDNDDDNENKLLFDEFIIYCENNFKNKNTLLSSDVIAVIFNDENDMFDTDKIYMLIKFFISKGCSNEILSDFIINDPNRTIYAVFQSS